jgi:hypothetical protein
VALKEQKSSTGTATYVIAAVVVLGAGLWGYLRYADSRAKAAADPLTEEARAYTKSLRLSDVTMKANKSYLNQMVIEIDGKISNAGERPVNTVEIYCVFYDSYGQVVLRQRLPIVNPRMGGLKPGETKTFRLPFDDLSESWNQQMPQLVIAAIRFG